MTVMRSAFVERVACQQEWSSISKQQLDEQKRVSALLNIQLEDELETLKRTAELVTTVQQQALRALMHLACNSNTKGRLTRREASEESLRLCMFG